MDFNVSPGRSWDFSYYMGSEIGQIDGQQELLVFHSLGTLVIRGQNLQTLRRAFTRKRVVRVAELRPDDQAKWGDTETIITSMMFVEHKDDDSPA